MPVASQSDVRKQIASGKVADLYLIIGPDDAGRSALAGEFVELVDEGLRAFNVDRLYGGEATAAQVVDAARTLPMMAPRRVVLLMHAERLLNPKRESEATARDLAALQHYIESPADSCCLVVVADALDRRRGLAKQLVARATVVECAGPQDSLEAARWVRERVAQEGMSIDARAARLAADRIWPDVGRLRSDVERLMLYAAGQKAITEADVREVIAQAIVPDDWAVTRAIERGSAAEALRELGIMLDNGSVPYVILGQLAWFVRTKMRPERVKAAVESVFRTDLAIKSSAGDPRALLEKLVVELCSR